MMNADQRLSLLMLVADMNIQIVNLRAEAAEAAAVRAALEERLAEATTTIEGLLAEVARAATASVDDPGAAPWPRAVSDAPAEGGA